MELRFVEGNWEHGKFKLQYREHSLHDWEPVPCVKEEPKKWCDDICWRKEGWWLSMGKGGQTLCERVKFCPLCGAKRPT